MPLKDLIAPKSALAEGVIEAIISEYVRYDTEEKEIAFTPATTGLSNKGMVLVYLVALQGWSFVTEETVPTDAKPAHIEERVGIPGGTLRPILKDLKDRHLIAVKDGAYSARLTSLAAIEAELNGGVGSARSRTKPSSKWRPKAGKGNNSKPEAQETASKVRRKPAAGKNGALTRKFDGWVDEGYFDQPRVLSDLQKRFHQEGAIIPQTSIPKYLLRAIRAGRLSREHIVLNGKQIWAYRTMK